MSLDSLQTAVAAFLAPRLTPPMVSLGGGEPFEVQALPAIAMSMSDVAVTGAGVGGHATSVLTGALPIRVDIDLADPVLRFPDDTVSILSEDRLELTVPHGPLVTSDGDDTAPLTAADFSIEVEGVALEHVAGAPAAGQFSVDRVDGLVRAGAPLADSGTLTARYAIGRWEAETIRMAGHLHLDLYVETATAAEDLTRQVFTLLDGHGIDGLHRLSATAMGTIHVPDASRADMRTRRLSFVFTFERVSPRVFTGGGLISTIDVTSRLANGTGVEPMIIR